MPLPTLNNEQLLICEGAEEHALATQMISENRAPAMDLTFIGQGGGGYGITGLRAFLEVLPGLVGFNNVKRIGLLADNDHNPQEMMNYIRDMFAAANNNVDVNGRYSTPLQPLVKATNNPISSVFIPLPFANVAGCLETLLLRVLGNLYGPKLACVEQAIVCSNISSAPENWTNTKIDEAKVRSVVSIVNQRNPGVHLSKVWKENPNLIPVAHAEFNDLSANLNAI